MLEKQSVFIKTAIIKGESSIYYPDSSMEKKYETMNRFTNFLVIVEYHQKFNFTKFAFLGIFLQSRPTIMPLTQSGFTEVEMIILGIYMWSPK